MPKFVVEVTDRYEIEADSFKEAEDKTRLEMADGGHPKGEYLDGYVSIEESEN
jgi:hypothetical protein